MLSYLERKCLEKAKFMLCICTLGMIIASLLMYVSIDAIFNRIDIHSLGILIQRSAPKGYTFCIPNVCIK